MWKLLTLAISHTVVEAHGGNVDSSFVGWRHAPSRGRCSTGAAAQTDEGGEDATRFSSVDRVDHESAAAPGPAGSR